MVRACSFQRYTGTNSARIGGMVDKSGIHRSNEQLWAGRASRTECIQKNYHSACQTLHFPDRPERKEWLQRTSDSRDSFGLNSLASFAKVRSMRLSMRETLMFITMVALLLPYVLPASRPRKQLPELIQFSEQDFAKWLGTHFRQAFDITFHQSGLAGTTLDSWSGDFEFCVPVNNSTEMLQLWKKNVESKLEAEDWQILDAWGGDDWFEYELQKRGSIRRLFCAVRPPSSQPRRVLPTGYEQVRLLWINSGFTILNPPRNMAP